MADTQNLTETALRQRLDQGMQQWERLAETQMAQLHRRLDTLLFQQQRVTEIAWRSEGMPLTPQEHQDGFTDLLHDLRDDRSEYQDAHLLTMVERQMDRLHQPESAQGQQQRDQGMGL